MATWLRALGALPEDLGLITNDQKNGSQLCISSPREVKDFSWSLWPCHSHGFQMYGQAEHPHV